MNTALVVGLISLVASSPLPRDSASPLPSDSVSDSDFRVSWLGPARGISRSWSASRDTPAMTMTVFPRGASMAGGEFAIATLRGPDWTLRGGFAGMLEIEYDAPTSGGNSGPLPAGDGPILWRGAYAYYLAMDLERWASELCSGCALELTLQYRHESQHLTASNEGGPGEDLSAEPYVGDDFILDLAFRQRQGSWLFIERLIGKWYLPERSSYSAGVGGDLHVRYLPTGWPQPFLSLYGEYLAGDDLRDRRFPNAYRLRALLGLAVPSDLGDILIYGAGDVGHRYGIRGLAEEATLGFGIRFALGAQVDRRSVGDGADQLPPLHAAIRVPDIERSTPRSWR